jgi:hypothetical protein
MSRVPYHALGRPYSGARGRFNDAPVVDATPVADDAPVVDATPVADDAPVVDATLVAPVVEEAVFDQVFGDALTVDDPPSEPEWDPTWTKARLVEVAVRKGLSVTLANTKADIVAALTAAG